MMKPIRTIKADSVYRNWVEQTQSFSRLHQVGPFSEGELRAIESWVSVAPSSLMTAICRVCGTDGQVLEVRGPCAVNPPEWIVFRRSSSEVVVAEYTGEVSLWRDLSDALSSIH